MTNTYHVHLYREMRLTFSGIRADSPEQATAIAREQPTVDADGIEDCDGADLGALVDVAGDEEYEHSRMIDFEEELLRKCAPTMLVALQEFIEVDDMAAECAEWRWESLEHAFKLASDVVDSIRANCPDAASVAEVTRPETRLKGLRP